MPANGAPNVVGTALIVGTPVWVVARRAVLCGVTNEFGGVVAGRGVSVIVGADGFGFSATDGGLRTPPPSSVEPSGNPAGPTDEPGPIDEANGGDAVVDAAHVPGAIPATPPPSKGKDSPVMELTVAVSAPVVEVAALLELPIPGDTPIIGLGMMDDAWPSEAPAHVAPIKGEAPNVVGLTPGVARSVAPMGCPCANWGIWNAKR